MPTPPQRPIPSPLASIAAAAAVAITGCVAASSAPNGADGGPGSSSARGKSDIFGEDERLEAYELPEGSRARQWLESTALMVQSSSAVRCEDDGCTLDGDPLKVCEDERHFEQPNVSACSAFLVAPDLVVTAGHCARSSDCDEDFVFGYFYRESPDDDLSRYDSDDVYHCEEIVEQQYETFTGVGERNLPEIDFAIYRLDRPVVGRDPLPVRREGQVAAGDRIWILGYPDGLPGKASDGEVVHVPDDQNFFHTDTDTMPGSSGSLVIGAESGLVEGVHVWGVPGSSYERDADAGCKRVSPPCDEVDLDDPDCMGNLAIHASLFAPHVPDDG